MNHIERAFDKMKERKWDCIYFAIDAHGTIFKSTYKKDNVFEYYPGAKEVLKYLSTRDDIKLILWTCSHPSYIDSLFKNCVFNHIYFDYVNENPEVETNELSNFSQKFYFDVVLDDKAGFNPETDWWKLFDLIVQKYPAEGDQRPEDIAASEEMLKNLNSK